LRADFRKNRGARPRAGDWTRQFERGSTADDAPREERVSGKGDLSRKRTVRALPADAARTSGDFVLDVDESTCLRGRVLSVHGLTSTVQSSDGSTYQCATRRLLKTLSTDQRHVVVAGDHVLFRPADNREGIIERIEPRHGTLSRTSRGRQHVLVANV